MFKKYRNKALGLELPVFVLLITLTLVISIFMPWLKNFKSIGAVIQYYATERNASTYLTYFNVKPTLDSGERSTLQIDELLGIYTYGAQHDLSQVNHFIPGWSEVYIDYGGVKGKVNLNNTVKLMLPSPQGPDECTPPPSLPSIVGSGERHFPQRVFYNKFVNTPTWQHHLRYPYDVGKCVGGKYLFKEEVFIPTPSEEYYPAVNYTLLFVNANNKELPEGIATAEVFK